MKLAVPDMISNSYFPAIAAIELGLFKAEGLDVSLEMIYPVDKAYRALADGAVDFVGGSAHSVLAAFPQWQGAKLLCAQAQGEIMAFLDAAYRGKPLIVRSSASNEDSWHASAAGKRRSTTSRAYDKSRTDLYHRRNDKTEDSLEY